MARIPLTDGSAAPEDLLAAILRRRGGALIDLDRLLLLSPPLAEGWNVMIGKIRSELALSPVLLELAICVVAALNRADYEMHHHAPLFLRHGGTSAQVDALAILADDPHALDESPLFDPTQRLVVRMAVASTKDVAVDADMFAAARAALGDDRLLFELVATIAAYNMVSRVLVAFELTPEG
ncbi:carboxymuconolactone decarboxylase family protein [Xanthobacter sp. KR7-225]|uniref:carboxymuconolactone decarboxylase family protein n=1 Tax=Xanthobacter sp. KR7-225 TaxID=3156613 RepID=UPI0032B40678